MLTTNSIPVLSDRINHCHHRIHDFRSVCQHHFRTVCCKDTKPMHGKLFELHEQRFDEQLPLHWPSPRWSQVLVGHVWWLAWAASHRCPSGSHSWGDPTTPAGEVQLDSILELEHEPSRCAVQGLSMSVAASRFLPCICRTDAIATLECLRAGCLSGGMQCRQIELRIAASPHSHLRHHEVCAEPRSHGLLLPWTVWTKLAFLSEQNVQWCQFQRMHEVQAKPLLCLVPGLPIMAVSAGHLMPLRWRYS